MEIEKVPEVHWAYWQVSVVMLYDYNMVDT